MSNANSISDRRLRQLEPDACTLACTDDLNEMDLSRIWKQLPQEAREVIHRIVQVYLHQMNDES
ncbi:hypothetical protein C5Y93_00585 [Blastopirellula marina]|uniref:Uncharacterized protein n=1 Tax=Blastopirellula marina TaxID=124 RepID=A0A2S8GUW5_9BACT|nr:hypothetical protein C5Y93_00585 [Blastopirellula marina]